MKIRPYVTAMILLTFLFHGPTFTFGAEGEREQESETDVIKERKKFNKLKRTSQSIYRVTMRSGVVFRLQTALGYISTIDLPENALKVFMGDQELYKVEVYEKQVLVKPITDELDARTNLIIVTRSGRLAFDVSVGAPETADFVLDFRLPQDDELLVRNAFREKVAEKTEELEKKFKEKEEKLNEEVEKRADQKLKEEMASAAKTISLKKSAGIERIQVNLLSLSQVGEHAYLRFSVLNYSTTPYRVLKVIVGAVTEEKKLLRKKRTGLIEFPAETSIPEVIHPDSYEYGVLAFDYRVLGKKEKPVFRIFEERPKGQGRVIEITGFGWFN